MPESLLEGHDTVLGGWSFRPHVRSTREPTDGITAIAATIALGVVASAFLIRGTPYRSAHGVALVLVAAGFSLSYVTTLMAGWWARRLVPPRRTVALLFGLVYLAPESLIALDLVAALTVGLLLRPASPRRAMAEAASRTLETGVAVIAFRLLATPNDLHSLRTWGGLLVAVLLVESIRFAGHLCLEEARWAASDDQPPTPMSIRSNDVGAAIGGLVIGLAAVVASENFTGGAWIGAVGATALVLATHFESRSERRIGDLNNFASLQDSLLDALASTDVSTRALTETRRSLDAHAVGVIHPAAGSAMLVDDSGVRPLDAVAVLADVCDLTYGRVGTLGAGTDRADTFATAALLGEGSFEIVFTAMPLEGRDAILFAVRQPKGGNAFTLADRELLMHAARVTGAAVGASTRLVELDRQAHFDELTGLPNRNALEQRIAEQLERRRSDGGSVGVMLLDLNGFKDVNDTLGHQTGDIVLEEIGRRIASVADRAVAVGRLGGDEFIVVLYGASIEDVDQKARTLTDGLATIVSQPIAHGDLVLDITISVGVSRAPEHGETPAELIRAADAAMYSGKEHKLLLTFYEGKLDRHRSRRLGLATDLRAALAADALHVAYQPKVSMVDGRLLAAEALIRWNHPTLFAVPAAEIIDIADHAGMLPDITDLVLRHAAAQCAALRKLGQEVEIAVNLSERDIADRELPERISAALATQGLPPGCITVEITETALLTQEVEALGVLPRVSEAGVPIAVDDFGTGFSSLSHLRKFPIDEIKIDMSFVERMVIRPDDAVIVRSIVELGHNLGMKVVAEGVETSEAWSQLARFGCDVAQGNYIMRAVDGPSLLAWATFWKDHRDERGGREEPTGDPLRIVEREELMEMIEQSRA